MAAFATQSRLVYAALFYWLYPWGYVSNVILAPLFQLLTFSLVATYATGAESAQRYMVGMITWAIVWIVISGILQSFAYDRGFGTLSLLFATPVSRLGALTSRAALAHPQRGDQRPRDDRPRGGVRRSRRLLARLGDGWGRGRDDVARHARRSGWSWAAGRRLRRTGSSPTRPRTRSSSHSPVCWFPTSDLPPVAADVGVLLPLTHGVEALRQAFDGRLGGTEVSRPPRARGDRGAGHTA